MNRANNRWKNLREANGSQNGANRWVRSNSSTGVKGVATTKPTDITSNIQTRGGQTHYVVPVEKEFDHCGTSPATPCKTIRKTETLYDLGDDADHAMIPYGDNHDAFSYKDPNAFIEYRRLSGCVRTAT
jgi:hypothetical protein